MDTTLGKRIVYNRKRLGLTQDQLAEQLGLTAQAVSKWENDQSCPDITMLPRLAEIFGISTDELLGHEAPSKVHEAEVVKEDEEETGVHAQMGGLEFHWDSGRRDGLGFAVLVLAVGVLTLLSNLLDWSASFWEILWPTALTVFGLFGLYPKFSFFRLGCLLFGGYSLVVNIGLLPFGLGGEFIIPVLVILFGLSLLADAIRKPGKPSFRVNHRGTDKSPTMDYSTEGENFRYSASFADTEQFVDLPRLSSGEIHVSFGDYDVDLSGVEEISEHCSLEAHCSFGELTLLVPRRFRVQSNGSTAFAEVCTEGQPDPEPAGVIRLATSVSFGGICIRYI